MMSFSFDRWNNHSLVNSKNIETISKLDENT